MYTAIVGTSLTVAQCIRQSLESDFNLKTLCPRRQERRLSHRQWRYKFGHRRGQHDFECCRTTL